MDCNPCPHGKRKRDCVDCNPCPHGKRKNCCVDCNLCPHSKNKYKCAPRKAARAGQPAAPEVKPETEVKPEPETSPTRGRQEPFTIRGGGLNG